LFFTKDTKLLPAANPARSSEAQAAPTPSDASPAKTAADATKIQCLDYGRSFLCGTVPLNNVRFWVESRTTIFDDQAHTSTVFYQCASCKSENTFGEQDLFLSDNYDFLPICDRRTA